MFFQPFIPGESFDYIAHFIYGESPRFGGRRRWIESEENSKRDGKFSVSSRLLLIRFPFKLTSFTVRRKGEKQTLKQQQGTTELFWFLIVAKHVWNVVKLYQFSFVDSSTTLQLMSKF